jgi:hypothetical protein
MLNIRFTSTTVLEQELDGSDESFASYHYAIYQCLPDEDSGVRDLRQRLKLEYPESSIPVGRHFVLQGEAAFIALKAYYQALVSAETLSEDFRSYIADRLQAVTKAHDASQSLPIPISLTEGQLSHDPQLDLLTCIAIGNGQVVVERERL